MSIRASKISSKGQITLPKDLRDKYHLIEGEEALILPTKEGILVKHRKASLKGILAGKIDLEGAEKDIKSLRREWRI
ncbi:MAG: AbrB/MazE/SpoVT family DNA-binding domain-containing protein [Candidatus Hydrothermarchaeales archaeon]